MLEVPSVATWTTTRSATRRKPSVQNRSGHEDPQRRVAHRLAQAIQGAPNLQLAPDVVHQLQRSVGNQATGRILTTTGPAAGPVNIMRYPSGVLDSPLKKQDWKKYTVGVKKSGEGVSGGVYFFASKRGGVKDVVVKAEDRPPEEKDNAGSLLASAGIAVPKGRNVQVNSAEGTDIVATAQKRGGYDLLHTGMGGYSDTVFLEVMSLSSGTSLSSAAKKAGNSAPDALAGNIDQLVQLLSTDNIQQQLGALMARDAIAGSTDRVIKAGLANIGNIMISQTPNEKALPRALRSRITAIDNEVDMRIGSLSYGIAKEALVELGKNPIMFVNRLLESIEYYLAEANPDAERLFKEHPQYGALQAGLLASLKKAAMKEALQGVISEPAPLAPSSDPRSTADRPRSKTEQPFEAELRRRRRMVWDAIKGT